MTIIKENKEQKKIYSNNKKKQNKIQTNKQTINYINIILYKRKMLIE